MLSPRPRPPRTLRRLVTGVLVVSLLAVLAPLMAQRFVPAANATYATGGSGQYKELIDWIEWGTSSGDPITNGTTKSTSRTIAGQTLTTSCTITNITGTRTAAGNRLGAYRPGVWGNDGLDDLYNSGAAGSNNRLFNGVWTAFDGDTANFDLACRATLNGNAVPLSGLVFADAEASNASSNEYVAARPNQSVNWHIIERFRVAGCSNGVNANLNAGTMSLKPTASECSGGGPMAIAYMQGATSANITVKGGGKSAVALGVVLEADFGDAPATYGSAGALFQRDWQGTTIKSGDNLVFGSGFTPATPTQPRPRLGATVDADLDHQPSAGATADDTTNTDDEDAVGNLGTINVIPQQPYTLRSVQCTGPGYVAGWIDWNSNGTFDSGERSAAAQCTGTSVNLTWQVPANVKKASGSATSFLRLRIAETTAELASPTGLTESGEVEDHAVKINTSTLTIQKRVDRRADSTDQFVLRLSQNNNQIATATTSGSATGIQPAQIDSATVRPGQTYNYSESMASGSASPLGHYNTTSQCTVTYPGGTSQTFPAQQGAAGTVSIPAYQESLGAPAVTCILVNDAKPATLAIEKRWDINGEIQDNGSQPEGIAAQARLTGAQARDVTWGQRVTGHRAGEKFSLNETSSVASYRPGCEITGQRLTSFNGQAGTQALPANFALQPGDNTAVVTNTVECDTTLTLTKKVSGGSASADLWDLFAVNPSGERSVDGTTGVSASVPAGQKLQLAEGPGPAEYVQDDTRTDAERAVAPVSTGSWTCAALDAEGGTLTGVLAERDGLNGTVTVPLGADVQCQATNRTAQLSILKFVENVNGTGTAQPSDWTLSATPERGIAGLQEWSTAGASSLGGNVREIRPGHVYSLSEAAKVDGYTQVGFDRFTGSNPADQNQLEDPENWESADADEVRVAADTQAVYRFVNRDVPAFSLPLTGSSGSSMYVAGGIAVALVAVFAAVFQWRRKRKQ